MIQLNGQVSQIFRVTEKQPSQSAKRNPEAKSEPSEKQAAADAPKEASRPLVKPSVINFEFVPSGRLDLRQEERQHLIDFFE